MSEASTRRRKQAGLTAIAIGLSLGVNADDHDVRIGRYQTVTVEAPLQEVELKPTLRPMEIPEDITTRGEALQWILRQHDYRLHVDSERLLIAAEVLATALQPEERQRPDEPLRLALKSLLEKRMNVMVDPGTKKVLVSIERLADDASEIRDGSE